MAQKRPQNLIKRLLGVDTIPVKRGKGLFLDKLCLSEWVGTKVLKINQLPKIISVDNIV